MFCSNLFLYIKLQQVMKRGCEKVSDMELFVYSARWILSQSQKFCFIYFCVWERIYLAL